jgi:hypothetical protein
MGILSQPLNTFWQLFFRPAGSSRWRLATPPGVALNGGLAITDLTDGPLTAGVEPTNLLHFSPLAQTSTHGRTWSPGLVPGALAPVPGALASSKSAGLLALLRAPDGPTIPAVGDHVVRSAGDPSTWTGLVTLQALASGAGSSCQIGALTSVAFLGAADVVGADCAKPGVVGVFLGDAGTWSLDGPHLTGSAASQPVDVLRLWSGTGDTSGVSGLIAIGRENHLDLQAIWNGGSGSAWTVSGALPIEADDRVVASGTGPNGEVFVLLRSGTRSSRLETVAPGGVWQGLTALPAGTATVALGRNGTIDALSVSTSVFTDWRRRLGSSTWTMVETLRIPIAIGSSS